MECIGVCILDGLLVLFRKAEGEKPMKTIAVSELEKFYAFIGEKLANGGKDLSPEEALDDWRELNPDPHDLLDDVAAIQAALDDLDNGEVGMPLDEFDRRMRKKLKMPPAP
jgi:hypothetical protein